MLGEILKFAEGMTKDALERASLSSIAKPPVMKTVWHGGPENLYDVGIKTLAEATRNGTRGATEGAGLFVGESPKVGEFYALQAKANSDAVVKTRQKINSYVTKYKDEIPGYNEVNPQQYHTATGDLAQYLSNIADKSPKDKERMLSNEIEGRTREEVMPIARFHGDIIEHMLKTKEYNNMSPETYLHKLQLPVDKMNWLEWDKPVPYNKDVIGGLISEARVKRSSDSGYSVGEDILKKLRSGDFNQRSAEDFYTEFPNTTGKEFYSYMTKILGSKEEASKFLDSQSIHGMKYPAADPKTGERYKGPLSNYVIYNPKKWLSKDQIERIGIYGLTGVSIPAAAMMSRRNGD